MVVLGFARRRADALLLRSLLRGLRDEEGALHTERSEKLVIVGALVETLDVVLARAAVEP